ncbi:MAG: acyltransferase family protein [Alphaproteobacteria bacterium]
MAYRRDIQILRGVAILFVLLFHLQAPGAASGFLGVDVFFVISGFLMACLYVPGSAGEFFARRARRILPAYFLTIFATLAAAVLVTAPPDLTNVTTQALYSTFLAPNLGFWAANSYFSNDSFTPLLHLWSVGVEIQFYVIVPLIALFVRRSRLLMLAALASLTFCFLAIGVSPKTAFFMLPFRLWEFLLGFIATTWLTQNGQPLRRAAPLAWLAVVVLLAAPFYGINGDALSPVTGHPGLAALAVCLATTVLLTVGLPRILTRSWPGSWLETLGKYSYSVYLVHFPLITLTLYEPFAGTRLSAPDAGTIIAMLIAIGVISVLLYHFVETPLRRSHLPWKTSTAGVQALLIAIALGAHPAVAAFYTDRANLIFAASADRETYRCGKVARLLDPTALTCALHAGDAAAPRLMLVGDSHADSIKASVTAAAREIDATLRFVVPNEPLIAPAHNAGAVIEDAVRHRVDHLLVHFSRGNPPIDALRRLVALAGQNGIRVSYIAPVPVWPGNIPKALYDNLRDGTPLPRQDIADYRAMNEDYLAPVRAIDAPNFTYFETAPYLCEDDCRIVDAGGHPLYFDNHHLTLTGAAQLTELFRRVLAHDGRPQRAA